MSTIIIITPPKPNSADSGVQATQDYGSMLIEIGERIIAGEKISVHVLDETVPAPLPVDEE